MIPIGNHILISQPRPIIDSDLIMQEENYVKAIVQEVSPDITVPFKKGNTIFFSTGREILLSENYIVGIEAVAGWE